MAKMAKDDPEVIADNLQAQRDAAPAHLQHYFLTFEDLWERKLWHELTEALVEFYNNAESADMRIPLFDSLCTTSNFSGKINQLKLVIIGLSAASQYPDNDKRLALISELANRVDKPASQEAFVYAQVAVASVKLQKQDIEGAQKDLSQCETILDTFDSVETSVHAAFYRVFGDYYQAKQEFASYYHNALLYLACVNLSDMSHDEQQHRAYDLSIAALVSETIYNFGELLLHPILDTLKDPKHAWLRDLLFAFNAGDLGAYDILTANSGKNKLLKEHESFLHQKICLSALTEAVFRRPPHDRSMTFNTIQNETKVQMDQIEHLMMKALSLGLIRGTIDQVAQVANINWVQPKVLDMKQIESMRSRLQEWDSGVNQLGTWMEGVGKDVWAA